MSIVNMAIEPIILTRAHIRLFMIEALLLGLSQVPGPGFGLCTGCGSEVSATGASIRNSEHLYQRRQLAIDCGRLQMFPLGAGSLASTSFSCGGLEGRVSRAGRCFRHQRGSYGSSGNPPLRIPQYQCNSIQGLVAFLGVQGAVRRSLV